MNPLVSPSWLADRLKFPDTVVLDATMPPVGVEPPLDTRSRYLKQHIPGAVFFDLDEQSDHSTGLPHMLATPEEFARNMSTLGVGSDMDIVVYEQVGVLSAPRVWWTLRTMGAARVYLLDGGLPAWLEAGYPVESGEVRREPATFRASYDSAAVKDFSDIQQSIAAHAQMLDARSSARFAGTAPEPRAGLSSGHMPGATSVPFTELVEDGRFKSADRLREIFFEKGVNLDQPITTTCGSGVTAAVVLLAAEMAGAKQVSLYDGSWAEYAQQPEAVIERTSPDVR